MRTLTWTTLLIAITETASGHSGKGSSAPARAATLRVDIQADSLNRLLRGPGAGRSTRRSALAECDNLVTSVERKVRHAQEN
jgi:hypothetical protein